jgi:hypothetical protein
MIRKTKGRDRWHAATLKTFDSRNPTSIHSSIKASIVRFALWGLIPASWATWLIQRGGLKDA